MSVAAIDYTNVTDHSLYGSLTHYMGHSLSLSLTVCVSRLRMLLSTQRSYSDCSMSWPRQTISRRYSMYTLTPLYQL